MKTGFKYSLFFLVLVCYAMFVTGQFTFSPSYSTYTDTFNAYGLHLFANPALFPGDRGAAAFKSLADNKDASTLLFMYLYKGLLPMTSLPWAMKIISLVSAFFSAFLIYRAGRRLSSSKETAFLLAAFHTIYFFTTNSFYYGQNRTLGALIDSLLIYALCSEKHLWIPFFIPLFYITYPYLAFSCAILAAALPFIKRKELADRTWSYLSALGGAAALTLLTHTQNSAKFMLNQGELFKYKLFSFSGIPLDPHSAWDILVNYVFNTNEHPPLYQIFTCILIAVIAAGLLKNGGQSLRPLKRTLGLACAAFLAGFLLLYPFSPVFAARQLSFFLPSMLALAAGLSAAKLAGDKYSKALPWLAALLFMAMHPYYSYLHDFKSFSGLYGAIGGLPVDARLAGDPASKIYAGVPMYSRRMIYFADEIDSVYRAAGGNVEQARKLEARIMCSGSAREIRDFARAERITQFLVEERFYPQPGGCKSELLPRAKKTGTLFKTSEGDMYLLDAAKL